MKRFLTAGILLMAIMIVSGCTSGEVGGYLGYPGFIVNPILYANTEIDGATVDLDIRDVYAVVYRDAAGNSIDNSLYIYFVPKSIDMNDIVTGNFKPFVLLKINDVSEVTPSSTYSITSDLESSNFMTWMDVNDGKDVFMGDTIDLEIWQISNTSGGNVEGEFTSTLSRNVHTGLAEDFKFEAPVNVILADPPDFT